MSACPTFCRSSWLGLGKRRIVQQIPETARGWSLGSRGRAHVWTASRAPLRHSDCSTAWGKLEEVWVSSAAVVEQGGVLYTLGQCSLAEPQPQPSQVFSKRFNIYLLMYMRVFCLNMSVHCAPAVPPETRRRQTESSSPLSDISSPLEIFVQMEEGAGVLRGQKDSPPSC